MANPPIQYPMVNADRRITMPWAQFFSPGPELIINVDDVGAVGDNRTDDSAAIQDAAAQAVEEGKTLVFPSQYYVSKTSTITGKFNFAGYGNASSIRTDKNIPIFTFDINTNTINFWSIQDLNFIGPVSSNTSSCALRFIGDNTSFVQHGYCRATAVNFNAFMKDEKPANSGEPMLNWNRWDVTLLNQNSYGFWCTQGSGTGNVWRVVGLTLTSGSAFFFFDGSGCDVGDIIIQGHFGCQASGGVCVKIGDNTAYRAQIDLTGAQFDANCTIPLLLSATGSTPFTNVTMTGNNLGGLTTLGANLQPLRNSNIMDRDASDWRSGNFKTFNTTGSVVTNCFEIDFALWGVCSIRVYANGLTAGVASNTGFGDYDISSDGSGVLTVVTNSTRSVLNGFAISVSTATGIATVKVTCTPGSSGTYFNASIFATGNDFKITRL